MQAFDNRFPYLRVVPRRLATGAIVSIAISLHPGLGSGFARAASPPMTICQIESPDEYGAVPEPDTSSDSDEEDDEPSRDEAGGLTIRKDQCLFPSLEFVAGNQANLALASFSVGNLKAASFNSQLGATFGLTHVDHSISDPLVTTLSMRGDGEGNVSVEQVSVHNRSFAAGMMQSRFDAWSGDEFTFRSLASSQSPGLVSAVLWRSDNSIALMSLESPTFRRVTVSGYGGMGWPDLVGRWSGKWGDVSLTLSAATHETPLDAGPNLRGYAGLASLKYELPSLGDGSYVLGQFTYARKALGYLGINTTSNLLGVALPGILSAGTAEQGSGLSGAIVGVWAPSDKWQFAAYSTAARLALPGTTGGSLSILRSAANAKWTPIKNFAFTFEGGYAKAKSNIPIVPDVNILSITITLARSI